MKSNSRSKEFMGIASRRRNHAPLSLSSLGCHRNHWLLESYCTSHRQLVPRLDWWLVYCDFTRHIYIIERWSYHTYFVEFNEKWTFKKVGSSTLVNKLLPSDFKSCSLPLALNYVWKYDEKSLLKISNAQFYYIFSKY